MRYMSKSTQYPNGKFYGMEEDVIVITLLCVVKCYSVTGMFFYYTHRYYQCRYIMQSLVDWSMQPTLSGTDTLNEWWCCWSCNWVEIWHYGYNDLWTLLDKFCDGFMKMWVPNPLFPCNLIYLLFDPTHLFKNISNNFKTKDNFSCPSMPIKQESDALLASFAHILQFLTEDGTHVMWQSSKYMEKTNVRLADSCFHESTIKALRKLWKTWLPSFYDNRWSS